MRYTTWLSRPYSLSGSRTSISSGHDTDSRKTISPRALLLIFIMAGIFCGCNGSEESSSSEQHVCGDTVHFRIPVHPASLDGTEHPHLIFTPKSVKDDSSRYKQVSDRWNADLVRLME